MMNRLEATVTARRPSSMCNSGRTGRKKGCKPAENSAMGETDATRSGLGDYSSRLLGGILTFCHRFGSPRHEVCHSPSPAEPATTLVAPATSPAGNENNWAKATEEKNE